MAFIPCNGNKHRFKEDRKFNLEKKQNESLICLYCLYGLLICTLIWIAYMYTYMEALLQGIYSLGYKCVHGQMHNIHRFGI